MDWCCDMFPFQKIQKTLTGNTDNPTTDQFGIPSSKRCKATTMFESCSSSLTSLEMTPPTVATTRAPQIPESIQNTSPKLQQVAGIDNSIGLFPDPEPILTPQKTRIVPTIVEQRFDGKVYVRMPNMQNPSTDWMAEGWLTGKKSDETIITSQVIQWRHNQCVANGGSTINNENQAGTILQNRTQSLRRGTVCGTLSRDRTQAGDT
jgi:hypothetical protein